jgi:hypothetical protein
MNKVKFKWGKFIQMLKQKLRNVSFKNVQLWYLLSWNAAAFEWSNCGAFKSDRWEIVRFPELLKRLKCGLSNCGIFKSKNCELW